MTLAAWAWLAGWTQRRDGVECAAEVTLRARLLPGTIPAPRVVTAEWLIALASAPAMETAVRAACDFIPPHVAIELAVHFQRQLRAAHLRERIAVTRQRQRTAEVQFVGELQFHIL